MADAAARLGGRRAAASAAELIASADVDVVHVCTPNLTHAELAAAALEAGKAVICEKPLATSTGETGVVGTSGGPLGPVSGGPVRVPLLSDRTRGPSAHCLRGGR